MKQILILFFLLSLNFTGFSQKIVKKTVYCYEGVVVEGNYVWNNYEINCGANPCYGNKVIIKEDKIIIKIKFPHKWEFEIKESLGSGVKNGVNTLTWRCYDKFNQQNCLVIYGSDKDGGMIVFEYEDEDNSVFGMSLIN